MDISLAVCLFTFLLLGDDAWKVPIVVYMVEKRSVVGEQRGSEAESRLESIIFQACAHCLVGSIDTAVSNSLTTR